MLRPSSSEVDPRSDSQGSSRRSALTPIARESRPNPAGGDESRDEKKQDEISIDCTNRGSHLLEDYLSQVQFTLGHLSLEIVGVDRIKGKMTCSCNLATNDVTLSAKLSWRMKFVVVYEGKKFRGHLVIVSMTREMLMDEMNPFPMSIAWFDEKSPVGLEFNQVTAILLSSRCRENVRKHYVNMEKRCIQEQVPKFQKKRQEGEYKNILGKKKADYNLTAISETLTTEMALKEKERCKAIREHFDTAQSSRSSASTSRRRSPLREGRAEHDAEGVAIGDIGEVHGILPKQLMLQDFFSSESASSSAFGTPATGNRTRRGSRM